MHRIRRFLALSLTDQWLLVRVLLVLLAVSVGVRVVRFGTVCRLVAAIPPSGPPTESAHERLGWAVHALCALLPWTSCLERSIALYSMLTLAGHPAQINFGVTNAGAGALHAHAWVECHGETLIDDQEVLDDYTTFPSVFGDNQ